MRITGFALAGALALAASAASAAPIAAPAPASGSNIVAVAGGCGWAFHANRFGRCVANRGHYRPHAYRYYRYHRPYAYWRRPYWPGYYGGGYGPWWGSPSDHVANQLNWQELHRVYGY